MSGELAVRNSTGAERARVNFPLSGFAHLLDCHVAGAGNPGLAATSRTHCKGGKGGGSQISVWGAEQWGWLSHGHGVPEHPPALPACWELPATPETWEFHAVMGKRAWERSPMPAQKQPLGCAAAQLVLPFLISLTAYKKNLHIWREIIPRENSQPAPSDTAPGVKAAWEWRSRTGHFPYHWWFATLPAAFFSANISTPLISLQSAESP